MQVFITYLPLNDKNGWFADAYMEHCCAFAKDYFPISVVTEDESAFSVDKTYVVGA